MRRAVSLTLASLMLAGGTLTAAHATTNTTPPCEEDQSCFDCHTMGNQTCRPWPVRIVGSREAGWRVTWSDGHRTADAGWSAIRGECRHDDHPLLCLAVWRTIESDRIDEQAMLRDQR